METQIAREITGKTHYQPDHHQPNDCQPDHTTVNAYFSSTMGLAGPADESSPVFDKVTGEGSSPTKPIEATPGLCKHR